MPPPSPPPANAKLSGRVFFITPPPAVVSLPATPSAGSVLVTLTPLAALPSQHYMPVVSSLVGDGGDFHLEGLFAGTYTLEAHAATELTTTTPPPSNVSVPQTVVLVNNQLVRCSIGLLVTADADPTTAHVIMQWDASHVANLDLRLTFSVDAPSPAADALLASRLVRAADDAAAHCSAEGLHRRTDCALSQRVASTLFAIPQAARRRKCQVWEGRPVCGGARWSKASDAWQCGSPTCSVAVLDTQAGGASCGARIDWLQSGWGGGRSPLDACAQVAREFPTACGACQPVGGSGGSGGSGGGGSGSTAEVITVSSWTPATPYQVFGSAQRTLCDGYGALSRSDIPGGGYFVDCVGSCQTGLGYCYAHESGYCGNCVLFDADPIRGQVLCADVAGGYLPQGGPLPYQGEYRALGSRSWGAHCADPARVAGVSSCASSLWERAAPTVSLVVGGRFLGQVVPYSYAAPDLLRADSDEGLEFTSAYCIEGGSARPMRALLDRAGFQALTMAPDCETAKTLSTHLSGALSSGCPTISG